MARPKKDVSADSAAAPADNGAASEKPKSQKEAVKLALRVKGKNAANDVLQDYIQSSFGMFLKKQNIATLKSQLKSEGRRNASAGPGPVKRSEGFTLEDLRLVQDLVARVGAKRVRDMIELFEK
jgi:hypothetical protein